MIIVVVDVKMVTPMTMVVVVVRRSRVSTAVIMVVDGGGGVVGVVGNSSTGFTTCRKCVHLKAISYSPAGRLFLLIRLSSHIYLVGTEHAKLFLCDF